MTLKVIGFTGFRAGRQNKLKDRVAAVRDSLLVDNAKLLLSLVSLPNRSDRSGDEIPLMMACWSGL